MSDTAIPKHRATKPSKVNKQKMLALSMVHEAINKHFRQPPLLLDGTVQGWGIFSSDKPELSKALESLKNLGEAPSTARLYRFEGGFALGENDWQGIQAYCHIFEDPKRPRAAMVSMVLKDGTHSYYFIHTRWINEDRPPMLIRSICADRSFPNK